MGMEDREHNRGFEAITEQLNGLGWREYCSLFGDNAESDGKVGRV